jgi:Domain of unknown function (DUF4265)
MPSKLSHEDETDYAVKVRFELEPEAEDWPPVASEGVWARPLGHHEYELDNVPWFARNAAYGDRVRAEPDSDGVLWVRERLAWSGRYTIRVIPLEAGPLAGDLQAVIDRFTPLGAECEGALPAYRIVALDIPPTARIAEIEGLLRQGEQDGWWGYEEGCIDDRWAAL